MPELCSWYTVVEGEKTITQGEFLFTYSIPVPFTPLKRTGKHKIQVRRYDLIVLSQSCDLVTRKLKYVVTCEVSPMSKFEDKYNTDKKKELLRRGFVYRYFLLDKCNEVGFGNDYRVVDFGAVHSIDFKVLEEYVKTKGKRLCLVSPFVEHISQSFARFFMRVGLPDECQIPKFYDGDPFI